jgi:hypothetical protein
MSSISVLISASKAWAAKQNRAANYSNSLVAQLSYAPCFHGKKSKKKSQKKFNYNFQKKFQKKNSNLFSSFFQIFFFKLKRFYA